MYVSYTSKGQKIIDYKLLLEDMVDELNPYRYLGNVYVSLVINNKKREEIISSDIASSYIRNMFRTKTNSLLVLKEQFERIIAFISDSSDYENVQLYHRVKFDMETNTVLYDIGDNRHAVEITAAGVSIIDKPDRTFITNAQDKPQKLPNLKTPATEVIPLMQKYINLPDLGDLLLFCVFIACALMGNTAFQHAIMIINSIKGIWYYFC